MISEAEAITASQTCGSYQKLTPHCGEGGHTAFFHKAQGFAPAHSWGIDNIRLLSLLKVIVASSQLDIFSSYNVAVPV